MGKFYLTNNPLWADKISSILSNVGFKLSGSDFEDGTFLSVYKKLSLDNYNLYKKNNNYVATTGTLIYKGKIGKDALEDILNDYIEFEHDINRVRFNCMGSFCLLIKVGKKIDVCVDELQSYYVHYYIKDDYYFITPQAYHIARITPIELDKISVAQKIACRTIPDDRTPFMGIHRLLSNEKLHIHCNVRGEVKVVNIGVNNYCTRQLSSRDKMLQALNHYAQNKASAFKTTGIFCTGGLDSRSVLAVNMWLKNKLNHQIELINWKSNDESIPAAIDDTLICQDMSKHFGIPLRVIDCTDSRIYENIESTNFSELDKYGEMIGFHAGNKKYHQMLEDDFLPDFIEYGCGGEVANQTLRKEAYSESYEDILEFYLKYTSSIVYKHVGEEKFRKSWTASWNKRLNILGISPDHLSNDDCTDIFNFYVLNENLDHINVTNLYRYSTSMFAQKEVFDSLSCLPYKEKDSGHMSLYIVDKFYPEFLKIPFYSHRKKQIVDFTTLRFVAESTHKSFKDNIKDNKLIGSIAGNIAEHVHEVYPHDKNVEDRNHRRKLYKLCKELGEDKIKMNSFSEITYLAEYVTWLKLRNYIKWRA